MRKKERKLSVTILMVKKKEHLKKEDNKRKTRKAS